jgi:hypothetical protein
MASVVVLRAVTTPGLEMEAERLGRQVGSLVSRHASEGTPVNTAIVTDAADVMHASPDACGTGVKASGRAHERRVAPRAVFIGHDTMLRLVNERAVPEGRPVPRAGQRPAGIQLLGVTPMGLGMRDGDILTDVEGRSVTSEAAVVGAVVAALSRHAPTIQARFFRAGRPWTLIVEIPYDARP